MVDNPILKDRYRLVEQIGTGGMAMIYRAEDMALDRTVAVKVLRPSLVDDPEFLGRFKNEARSAANLAHPNIVTVHDVGQDGPKTHFIVMEYVPGQDLKKLIRAHGSLEVDAALAVVVEVCKGVGYAHRAGLVHCDMKPQNILVTPDNSIKVTDFGIARALSPTSAVDETAESSDIVWGSPHYFSPEQAAGEPPTPASDVYSIGVVLFELLTGQLPFVGVDYRELALAHLKTAPPALADIDPAIPAELDRIVQKVMDKEPSSRYRTADQLGRILEKYRERGHEPTSSFVVNPSGEDSAPPPPAPEPTIVSSVSPQIDSYKEPPQSEQTIPGMPPVDFDEVRARIGRRAVLPTDRTVPSYENYTDRDDTYALEDDDEFIPGVDIYGIVLGVLAAVAVLGLIPVWIAVYITLTN